MFMTEIISKKKSGLPLEEKEIQFFVNGFTEGVIPDYQVSALLMAIYLNGMTDNETVFLTMSIMRSGKVLNLSELPGIKVDKHSTGGVGDKVSLILGPLVASCGCSIPMISGRGLGHTGGTLDKLESIPGFTTTLSTSEFITNVKMNGFSVMGQTDEIAPADKKLYALRDVTSTVASIPLIVASILSKKFASGADAFVFDVKVGTGAFMKEMEQALSLGRMLVKVSSLMGKNSVAYITDMNAPLGVSVGNALEVEESIECLRGSCSEDLWTITSSLAAEMLILAGKARSKTEAMEITHASLTSGRAIETLRKVIDSQQGNSSVVGDNSLLPRAKYQMDVLSAESGYVEKVDALKIALSAKRMGAGREKMSDTIRKGVGVKIFMKPGEKVRKGDRIATVYGDESKIVSIEVDHVREAFSFCPDPLPARQLIYFRITENLEERFQ
jgi:pyrimidine-nucleoside phosphorylase